MQQPIWVIYALLSAFFAGCTAVLAKFGMETIPANIGTLVRTAVVLVFITVIVIAQKHLHTLLLIPTRGWMFLLLSGLATGLSWICYFAAIKLGPISVIAPIDKLSFVLAVTFGILFFGEKVNKVSLLGITLVILGVLITIPSIQLTLANTLKRTSKIDP